MLFEETRLFVINQYVFYKKLFFIILDNIKSTINMKLQRILGLIVFALFMSGSVFAQQKSITQQADDLFDQKQYIAAIDKYEKAYSKVKSNRIEKNRITFQIAECYRLMANYPKAIDIYKRLIKAKYYNVEPKIYFYMAEAYRFNNDFDESAKNYDEYLKLVPNDKLAKVRKESLAMTQDMIYNRTRHVVEKPKKFNSDENDWSPTFLGNDTSTVAFTSSRKGSTGKGIDGWTGQPFSDIYLITKDRRGNWVDVDLFDKDLVINTEVNEGEASFSPDGNTIYFTRCDNIKRQTQGCAIYTSSKASGKKRTRATEGESPWSEPQKVALGDSIYTYVHPSISADGLTLYFASDMPGGEGDMDLWKATRNSAKEPFGAPVNLGKNINTPGKELYPVLRNDSVLYFSSNGLPGMGGFDLFKTQYKYGEWTKPENLGYPINTSYDEIGIIYYPRNSNSQILERGYFSSNRPSAYPHDKGAKKEKKPSINDEIWYFELPPLLYTLQGIVRDEKSMQLISGAKVKIVGSDGSINEANTNRKGQYFFSDTIIRLDVTYSMYISKIDYFSTTGSVSTVGYTVNKDLVQDFRLEPVPKDPVVLPEIRYDLAKWDLKEQYQDSLIDLLIILRNNPSFVIELRSHTDCRPFITLTNDTLSQRRAESVVDYLIKRGIDANRLVAKGYSDRVPRTLDKNMKVTYNGKAFEFRKGTTLTCDYIKSLKNKDEEEAAHQLNRRTEFYILRTDYSPAGKGKKDISDTSQIGDSLKVLNLVVDEPKPQAPTPSIVYNENKIPLTMIHSTKGEVDCIVNGALMTLLVDEKYKDPVAFSWEEAMRFLLDKRINKEDFPERDNAFDPEGKIIENSIIVLKTVQIGPRRVENLEAVVVKNLPYKIIMNRFGLNDFGEYEFDKQKGLLIFK